MKRAIPLTVGAGLLVLALGLLGWKVWADRDETTTGELAAAADTSADRADGSGAPVDDDGARADRSAQQAVEKTVLVVDAEGLPSAGVAVTLVEPRLALRGAEAGAHALIECDDDQHLREIAERARRGELVAEVLGLSVTDATGVAHFSARRWPAQLQALVERADGARAASDVTWGGDGQGQIALHLGPSSGPVELRVVDASSANVAGARVTLIDAVLGTATEARTDGSGAVQLRGDGGRFWVLVEADGALVTSQVLALEPGLVFNVTRPGAVEVLAVGVDEPVPVTLSTRHPRRLVTHDGRARFDRVYPGISMVTIEHDGLLGSAEGEVPEGGDALELILRVKRAARVLVTVVDAEGDPVPGARADLSTPTGSFSAIAEEEGQRLVLGPVAVGGAVLKISAGAFKTRAMSLELKPNDNDVEVVMAQAPAVRGQVLGIDGLPATEATVQVRSSVTNEPEGAVTDREGRFTLHVEEPGTWALEATVAGLEVARAVAQVPGPDVVLRLEALGRARVTVLDPEGRPAAVTVLLAGAESSEPDVGETNDQGELLFEELVPGEYRLEVVPMPHDDGAAPGLRTQQQLVIRSGEEAAVTLRLRLSASISGVLLDVEGQPAAFEQLIVRTGAPLPFTTTETLEDGTFELTGLEPGVEVSFRTRNPQLGLLTPSTARAGAKGLRLRATPGKPVTGRVVGADGQPLTDFQVNEILFDADDGRFEATADDQGRLVVAANAHASTTIVVGDRSDVGDVVLEALPLLTGVVLDEQRRPVASASLTSPAFGDNQAVTDATGHFSIELTAAMSQVQVHVSAEELGAVVSVPVGATPVEIVINPPTRVHGLVRGPDGRPVATTVLANSGSDEVRVDSDEQGRFELSLAAGTWFLGTWLERSLKSLHVTGREQHVELGGRGGDCAVSVSGAPNPSAVYLVSAGEAWTPTPDGVAPVGVVSLSHQGASFVGQGLSCGAWVVHATYGGRVVSRPVSLSSAAVTPVRVEPELSTLEDTLRTPRVIMLDEIRVDSAEPEQGPGNLEVGALGAPTPQVVEPSGPERE